MTEKKSEIAKIEDNTELVINPWSKLEVVKACFAPKLTNDEFKIFVGLGKSLDANPFTREIWAVKYKTEEPAQIFCGRDFYRRKAQEQLDYDGHVVNAIYENDSFDCSNGIPNHSIQNFKDRGNLVGSYCAVYRKNITRPYLVTVKLKEYDKGFANWKSMPETMIKKVAEAQALRGGYQGVFRGTYDESEAWQELPKQNTIAIQEKTEIEIAKEKIIALIDTYPEPDKTEWKLKCVTASKEGKFDMEFALLIAKELNIEL